MFSNRRNEFGTNMKNLLKLLFICAVCVVGLDTQAQSLDQGLITQEAERFLKEQTKLLAETQGKVEITVSKLDPRLKLQSCEKLTAFLTPGSKAWGKITLRVQCTAPKAWTVYLGAQVKVFGDYFVTRNAVSQGQILSEQDLIRLQGEVSSLPAGYIAEEKLAIGKTMLASYPAGVNLRREMFKVIPVIQQGQTIKISSSGLGFTVTNDAVALNNAAEGQIARARTSAGQVVSGIAKIGGFIEVN
jgi:flagella basal body P-ring formation protein FlgA